MRYLLNAQYRGLIFIIYIYHLAEAGFFRYHNVITQKHRKRFISDKMPCRKYRMSQATGLLLPYIMDICHLGYILDHIKHFMLTALLKFKLKFYRTVKMILYRPFVPAGDYDYILYPGCNGFLDDILYSRLVDYREHLLGLCLGRRQKPCSQACCRYYRLPYLHPSPPDIS